MRTLLWRTRIGAVIDHGQTVSTVALGKMVERLYSVYSPQAGIIEG